MSSMPTIRKATVSDIDSIGYLAYQIWPYAYRDTLSFDRLHYMLSLLYAPQALKKQIEEEDHKYFIAEADGLPVGFAAYSFYAEPATYKLHKLYVLMSTQGKGLGKALLDKVETAVRLEGGNSLLLNVKRDNIAIRFYEKCGFVIAKEEDVDIGNSYFMNDYVMEKNLV
ncbi:MAG: GNAT family N-acetyltransferase [Chitinophagaceae bacterium]|nr:GNAT family N-acetyltransferase [Chitinophagaceae bacterium]